MSRHLIKLQSLIGKLEMRYGAEDSAVRELRDRVHALELLEREGAALKASSTLKTSRPPAVLL